MSGLPSSSTPSPPSMQPATIRIRVEYQLPLTISAENRSSIMSQVNSAVMVLEKYIQVCTNVCGGVGGWGRHEVGPAS